MITKKYYKFYYGVDKDVYPDINYWKLYNKNKIETIKTYDGKMFCPECLNAPLTVAKGKKPKYFKVAKSNMHKHLKGCTYLLNKAAKEEINEYSKSLTMENANSQLNAYMNKILDKKYKNII